MVKARGMLFVVLLIFLPYSDAISDYNKRIEVLKTVSVVLQGKMYSGAHSVR